MLHTSEQFATKLFMERHDDVAHGVTSRQTDRRERQAARSGTANDEYLREASRLGEHDQDGRKEDKKPDARGRSPERRDA